MFVARIRGFQAYLSTAPKYDFFTYRQMVHEITQTFSLISQHIIEIQNKLSKHESFSSLVTCICKIQELEQAKLRQVNPVHNQSYHSLGKSGRMEKFGI